MIRAVGNKRLDLSDQEFKYYNDLISHVDKTEFNSIFETDKNGKILFIMPNPERSSSLITFFFLMNVMFNQRIRGLETLSNRVSLLENKLTKILEDNKI